ncbi:MAG: hypothetical protein QNJ16_20410 [Rhodobacter sp.]|nr:hypothetical protein [Rhodobacter sp.]
MRLAIIAATGVLLAVSTALAEPIDGKTARKMLFAPKGFEVEIVPDSGLDETQRGYVALLVEDREFKKTAKYYGAMAVSPSFFDRVAAGRAGPGTLALLKFTDNFNSPAAAAAAALRGCNAGRARGDRPCVLAARILPKRWEPRDLTLSSGASQAFKVYRREGAPKAFAVSDGSPAFSVVAGENAVATALERCNTLAARAGGPDCTILIAD